MPTEVVRAVMFKEWEFVLLQQRPDWSKLDPNRWQLPGGQRKEEDTSLEAAMIRKLTQELGLRQTGIALISLSSGHGEPEWPTTVFRADLDKNNEQRLQPNDPILATRYEELSRCRWFSKQEFTHMLRITNLSKDHPLLASILSSILSTRSILEGRPAESRLAFDTGSMVSEAYKTIDQFGT